MFLSKALRTLYAFKHFSKKKKYSGKYHQKCNLGAFALKSNGLKTFLKFTSKPPCFSMFFFIKFVCIKQVFSRNFFLFFFLSVFRQNTKETLLLNYAFIVGYFLELMCKTSFASYLIDTQTKLNVQNSIKTTAVVTFFQQICILQPFYRLLGIAVYLCSSKQYLRSE